MSGLAATPRQKWEELRLNLGCSDRAFPGYVGVDIAAGPAVDEVADLRERWPWGDNTVADVMAYDIIEHLPDKIHTMNELWRVLRVGGRLDIEVPTTDGPGAFQDPTHVSYWHRRSFLYYTVNRAAGDVGPNPYRERFAKSYGIKAAFRVISEQVIRTVDGPKLRIVLEKV